MTANVSDGTHPEYRLFVGPPHLYDALGAIQFNVMTHLGLREHHTLLDIGCGSLRAGRLFIPYLLPGHYFGMEPNGQLVQEGINHEVGNDIVELKRPEFSYDEHFTLSVFGRRFDFLLAHSIFSHAAPDQVRRCMAEARSVMHEESVFAFTYLESDENYEGTDWVYPGAAVYTPDRMAQFVEEQGLACMRLAWPHPSLQTWIVATSPGNIPNIAQTSEGSASEKLQKRVEDLEAELRRLRREMAEAGL